MSTYALLVVVTAFALLTASLLAGYGWFFRRSIRDGPYG
jgi:hypothetical protein